MGTIFNLCGLLCLIALLSYWRTDRDLLDGKIINKQISNGQITNNQNSNHQIFNHQINKSPDDQINQLLNIAKSQIGVREATGNNDGEAVERFLLYTGNKKGEPWCAAFVSWVFGQAGYSQPRTAWSPSLLPKARQVGKAKPAMVFGIYFKDKGRIAHAGLVEKQQKDWVYTIEGNTNAGGSNNGNAVMNKIRNYKQSKLDFFSIESLV